MINAILILLCLVAHPIHVSVTEIAHKSDTQTLQITSRIFADDLADILKETYGPELDVFGTYNKILFDSLMTRYLAHHFDVHTDGNATELHYLGHEVQLPVIWIYVEGVNVTTDCKSVKVRNSILMDKFDDQENMVHVYRKGDQVKSMLLKFGAETRSITFDE